ncbi:MAG: DsbA family protein [Nanoarchaeota archaeon]|nr:DsbA family protein [Nanoarchaeota archaeon]
MICLIALIVLAVLSIFSASHRPLFKEALDCVGRRLTFRPCESKLDERLKSKITGALLKKNKHVAKFVYKRFEIISWILLILMIGSIFFSAQAGYYYARYGNCNGPDETGFCIFDPLGTVHEPECAIDNPDYNPEDVTLPVVYDDAVSFGDENAKVTVIEAGCFECDYTRQAVPVVKKILEVYGDQIRFVYMDFPIKSHESATKLAEAAHCAHEQDKFWDYYYVLFENQEKTSNEELIQHAEDLSLNIEQFTFCLESEKYKPVIDRDFNNGVKAGIYGTPTFFVNEHVLVGPKDFNEFKVLIEQELNQ